MAVLDPHVAVADTRPAPRLPRTHLAAVVAVVATPILVALGRALTASAWVPVSDLAFLEAKVRDVGGSDTPLTGAYSRLGFDHPGPLEAWVIAPLARLWGGDPRAMLVAAGAVNLLAVGAALTVANRRGGRPLVAITATALLLLEAALAAVESNLIDPWNPTVAVLPFVAALLLGWDTAVGRVRSLPLFVLAATWTMQAHAGYLPVTGVLALGVAVALGVRTVRGRQEWRWRPVVLAAVVGAAAWVGPVVDQVAGDGNLAAIVEANADAAEPPVGLGAAAGILATELRPVGPWSGAEEDLESLTAAVVGISAWWLVLPAAALGATAAIGVRQRRWDLLTLAALLGATAAAAWAAVGRITGPAFAYLLHWSWALAAVIWVSVTWALWVATERRREAAGPSLAARLPSGLLAVVAVAALAAGVHASATEPLPNHRAAEAVAEVSAALRAALDPATPTAVEVTGAEIVLFGPAVQLDLERHGFDVCEPPPADGTAPALDHRSCSGPTPVTVVVATDAASAAALAADPGVDVVATSATLDADERAELDDLLARIPPSDLLWAGVARLDGTEISPPPPGADYTVADVERALDLRARDLTLAIGIRTTDP